MAEPRILGIVLAGGEGKRLAPLTDDRAKPAVPFGGLYRLIDFVLSNLVNAASCRIAVLTQYKSHSLDRHITMTWRMSNLLGNYVTPVPAQQRLGPRWYTGSADAIFQSLNLIYDERPDLVVVFGADHVYRMDPRQMVEQHLDGGAGVTVAGIRGAAPGGDASSACIDAADDGGKIDGVPGEAGRPAAACRTARTRRFASMGNYVFTTEALLDALHTDAADEDSVHDMGGNIIPMLAGAGRGAGLRLPDQRRARATERRPRLLARRRDDRRLLRRAHGPRARSPRSSTSTTPAGRSSPAPAARRRRSSSTTTATGSARRSTASSRTA